MKIFLLWVGQGSNGEWCKYCHVSYTSSPKNTNFFICGPISTYGSSFCRSKYLKQLLPHTFFSNTNISPSQGPSFANLPCLRIMRTGKMTKSQKIKKKFTNWPIQTCHSSFCGSQRKKQLLVHKFFSKIII